MQNFVRTLSARYFLYYGSPSKIFLATPLQVLLLITPFLKALVLFFWMMLAVVDLNQD